MCRTAFLILAALVLATSSPAAARPGPSELGTIVSRLTARMSRETAAFVARAIFNATMKGLTDGRYTVRPVGIREVPRDLGPCLALPKSFEVVMQATAEGDPVSRNPLSVAVPFDPNARIAMTSVVRVEVAAFYPVKDIRYTDGRLSLPKAATTVAGYTGKEGERSEWTYHGGFGWDEEKKRTVANDLTLKALDVAKEVYARSQRETEAELTRAFEKALNDMIQDVTRQPQQRSR